MSEDKINIGKRLAEEILATYKTKRKFALSIGISPQALQNYTRAKITPGRAMLEKFKKAGLDVNYILYGERSAGDVSKDVKEGESVGSPEAEESLDTPQKRLDYFIRKKYVNKSEFAKVFGVSRAAISRYTQEGGRAARKAHVLRRLQELGLNLEWYLYGVGNMEIEAGAVQDKKEILKKILISQHEKNIETISDFVEVPVIESAFPCGKPDENDGSVVRVPFLNIMVGDINNPYVLKCEDDSMEPVISVGDYVIVEGIDGNIDDIPNSEIVVAFINNELVIRKFSRSGRYFVLIPENEKKYEPYVFKKGDDCEIFGIVRRKLETVRL